MTRGSIRSAWPAPLCLSVVFGLAVVGCQKKAESTDTGSPPVGNSRGGPPGGMGAPSPQDVLAKLPGGEEFAAGKKVYADNNCARCHKLGDTGGGMGRPPGMGGPPGGPGGPPGGPGGPPGMGGPPGGPGGPPGMSGPDLTKTGAETEHTTKWLSDHIRNPKSHSPKSSMPASGVDKISDADLKALVEYLASRK